MIISSRGSKGRIAGRSQLQLSHNKKLSKYAYLSFFCLYMYIVFLCCTDLFSSCQAFVLQQQQGLPTKSTYTKQYHNLYGKANGSIKSNSMTILCNNKICNTKYNNKSDKKTCHDQNKNNSLFLFATSSNSKEEGMQMQRQLTSSPLPLKTAKRVFGFLCTTLLAYIYITMYGRHTILNNVSKSIQTFISNIVQNNNLQTVNINRSPELYGNYMKAAAEIVLDSYRDFQLVPKDFNSASRLSDGSQFTLPPWLKNPYALATLVGKGPLFFGVYGFIYYKAVTKLIPAEANRVRAALEDEEEEKKKYIEKLKEKEGINLGSIKGSFSSNELMLIKIVENGDRLKTSEKTGWQQLLQRAKYTKDVMDGKRKANKDIPVMNKYELKRVIKANKLVKEKGFE